jgi:hypothetical protein
MGVMASLKSLVLRVEQYLKYQDYHAQNTYPYPEDQNVAEWVREEAEPNGWTRFPQDEKTPPQPADPGNSGNGTDGKASVEPPIKNNKILTI